MLLKTGPYGKYLECVECKNRKKYVRSTGVKCPKCGEGEIIEKKSKAGKIFFFKPFNIWLIYLKLFKVFDGLVLSFS